MSKVLIVVDMQNDFVYGPLGTPEARAIVPNVKKKIDEYYERGDKVIFTLDSHSTNYLDTHEGKYLPVEHCRFNTPGWEIVSELQIRLDSKRIRCKSSFGLEWWYSSEQNIYKHDSIELVGVCTDICVVSNALILRTMLPGHYITVDASCCAGTTPKKHKAALEVMKSCHIDVIGE